MNTAMSYAQPIFASPPGAVDENLLDEIDRYRQRSEWLLLVNALHGRLAAALDLGSMVEAYSVWLMPLCEHDLLAYYNPDRQRGLVLCSSHGPDRRAAGQAAEKLFAYLDEKRELPCRDGDFHIGAWALADHSEKGYLLILRRETLISQGEKQLIEATLEILADTLRRALDYEELYDQARRDMLTGLANRRVLEERLGPLMGSARRHDRPLTMASMDLDNFKNINDTLGHTRGDKVLKLVAQTLAGMIRQSDLLVRMGGDEFLLVLPDTSVASGRILADRLCNAVDQLDIVANRKRLGISIGLSQWRSEYGMKEWLRKADENLYKAKEAGRSQVCAA